MYDKTMMQHCDQSSKQGIVQCYCQISSRYTILYSLSFIVVALLLHASYALLLHSNLRKNNTLLQEKHKIPDCFQLQIIVCIPNFPTSLFYSCCYIWQLFQFSLMILVLRLQMLYYQCSLLFCSFDGQWLLYLSLHGVRYMFS